MPKVICTAVCLWIAILSMSALAQKSTPPKAKTPTKAQAPQSNPEEIYRTTCQLCHGPDGNAPVKDMNLADGEWKHGGTTAAIVNTITNGVPGTAMVAFKDKFSRGEILALAKLVRSFEKANKAPIKKKSDK